MNKFLSLVLGSTFLLLASKDVLAFSSWSPTSSLPYTIASQVAFGTNTRIFQIGGSAATGQSRFDVLSANVHADGSLDQWTTPSAPLPKALIWHSIASSQDNVYILGGREENPGSSLNHIDSVFLGKIDQANEIPSWNLLNSLPYSSSRGAAAVAQNRLYYAGGFNDSGVSDEVYFAEINPDGTIGSWELAGHMPTPLNGFGLVAHGDKLIFIGGKMRLDNDTISTVRIANIDSDGTIASWELGESLPENTDRPGVTQYGDYIIVAGGFNEIHILDTVYYSKIQPDGSLSPWTNTNANLPRANCCSPIVIGGNYLFILGGHDGKDYYDDVYTLPLSSIIPISKEVPSFKQTDEAWGNDIYDTANNWAPTDPSISAWGCAVTSAAMVFNYHGITHLPDSTVLNPGTLNQWLKSQPDGYIRDGLVNWLSLSRLSKMAKDSPLNSGFGYDALEYSRTSSPTQLTNDLTNNIPGILEVPGHFIVATGIQDQTYAINDPYYSYQTLAEGYDNSFLTLNRFVPSNTDLSYFLIVADKLLSMVLVDKDGNTIGNSFLQEPLHNESNDTKSGDVFSELLQKNPPSGKYILTLSSPTTSSYNFSAYLYDKDGNPYQKDGTGFISKNKKEKYIIEYDHETQTTSSLYREITFTTLIDDINEGKSLKLISKGYATSLLSLAKGAQRGKNKTMQIKTLEGALKTLELSKGRLIQEEAYDILKSDITYLLASLR